MRLIDLIKRNVTKAGIYRVGADTFKINITPTNRKSVAMLNVKRLNTEDKLANLCLAYDALKEAQQMLSAALSKVDENAVVTLDGKTYIITKSGDGTSIKDVTSDWTVIN